VHLAKLVCCIMRSWRVPPTFLVTSVVGFLRVDEILACELLSRGWRHGSRTGGWPLLCVPSRPWWLPFAESLDPPDDGDDDDGVTEVLEKTRQDELTRAIWDGSALGRWLGGRHWGATTVVTTSESGHRGQIDLFPPGLPRYLRAGSGLPRLRRLLLSSGETAEWIRLAAGSAATLECVVLSNPGAADLLAVKEIETTDATLRIHNDSDGQAETELGATLRAWGGPSHLSVHSYGNSALGTVIPVAVPLGSLRELVLSASQRIVEGDGRIWAGLTHLVRLVYVFSAHLPLDSLPRPELLHELHVNELPLCAVGGVARMTGLCSILWAWTQPSFDAEEAAKAELVLRGALPHLRSAVLGAGVPSRWLLTCPLLEAARCYAWRYLVANAAASLPHLRSAGLQSDGGGDDHDEVVDDGDLFRSGLDRLDELRTDVACVRRWTAREREASDPTPRLRVLVLTGIVAKEDGGEVPEPCFWDRLGEVCPHLCELTITAGALCDRRVCRHLGQLHALQSLSLHVHDRVGLRGLYDLVSLPALRRLSLHSLDELERVEAVVGLCKSARTRLAPLARLQALYIDLHGPCALDPTYWTGHNLHGVRYL